MDKKCFFICTILLFLAINVFSNSLTDSGISFLNKTAADQKAAGISSKFADLGVIDSNLRVAHAVFAGITYAGLWALDIIGGFLLYNVFANPDYQYMDYLKFAHIGVAAATLLTFATVVTLAFTKLGIKIKNGFEIRKTHFAAAITTLSFYLLELSTIIVTAVYFANNLNGAKWTGLAHGITCGATTMAFSVSFITIFF